MGKLEAAENSVYASRWELFTPYVAEYVGTLVITLTFICNCDDQTNPYFASISTGFMVLGMVSATKHITGANLNPSVSVALCLAGRQRARVAMGLCLAQLLGALTAALAAHEGGVARHLQLGPDPGHNWFQVGCLETLYACMLCFVYLNCAASKQNNPKEDQNGFSGLAYGLCYIAAGYAAKGICDSVSNSAIAFGLTVLDSRGDRSIQTGMTYLLYDLLGAFLGAGAYRVVRPQEFQSSQTLTPSEELDSDKESAQLAAEFIGTFYIVLTQVSSKMCVSRISIDLGPQAWGTSAAVTAMVYALRNVSGAHFNPAVTLAVRANNRGPSANAEDFSSSSSVSSGADSPELRTGIFYALAQALAGIAAAFTAVLVNAGGRNVHGTHEEFKSPLEVATTGQTMMAEGAMTAFLCYVVLATSVSNPVDGPRSQQNNVAGLAYGSCIMAATYAVGNISGGLLNPASVVAFSFLPILHKEASLLPYVFYQVTGAVLASLAFLVTHAHLHVKEASEADEKHRMGL